jgi:carotenoid cleavage dioxygenase
VKEEIAVSAGTMIHDFAITDRDVVFWEFPVVFDLAAAAAAAAGAVNPFTWDASCGSLVGVMPLGGPAAEMRWVEIDNGYVFHGTNAYRDDDRIVLDVSRIPSVFNDNDINDSPSLLNRWTIGTGGDELTWTTEQVSELSIDFPEIDHRVTGRAHSVAWYTETHDTADGNLEFPGLAALDVATGELDRWTPGPARQPGEALFVPDPPDSAEGEGWLLTFIWDQATDRSSFVILDATDVGAVPVAEIDLPRRVPFGFHGTWPADS